MDAGSPSHDLTQALQLPDTLIQQLYCNGLLRDVCSVSTRPDTPVVTITMVTGTWLLCAFLEGTGWLMIGSALL